MHEILSVLRIRPNVNNAVPTLNTEPLMAKIGPEPTIRNEEPMPQRSGIRGATSPLTKEG